MSLFIAKENQQLLYEMIHKTPEINEVFSNVDEKNRWFRGVIDTYYQKLPSNLSREMLLATNRQVLGYMVGSLREMKRPITPIKKEIPLQYMPIFDMPKPQTIDFSEKIEDEVITNMAELIEQQKRMRERELQEYSPPAPQAQQAQVQAQAQQTQVQVQKVNIMEDLPKNVLQPIERQVRFEEPMTNEIIKRMDKLENKIDELVRLLIIQKSTDPTEDPVIKENITLLKQIINDN
jgi:hypothetical protein